MIGVFYVHHLGNHAGCLKIKIDNGKYFWSIDNYFEEKWFEISPELFDIIFQQQIKDKW